MECSMPGLPVHYHLPEFTQTHVHWFGDAIQPSHPLLSLFSHLQSFPASRSFQMSQFFASGSQTIGVSTSASVLPMNMKDWFPLGLTGLISSQESSPTPQFKSITSLVLSFLYGSTFTSIHDYLKNIVNFNFILHYLDQKLPFFPKSDTAVSIFTLLDEGTFPLVLFLGVSGCH